MKRTPLAILASGLLFLSGCSGSDEAASTPTAQPESETAAPEPTPAQARTEFQTEVDRVSWKIQCDTKKVVPASDGFGALFSCISGPAETSKFFINEDVATGKVKSIKFLWNDWFKDVGYGLHADSAVAAKMLESVLVLYPSQQSAELRSAFSAKKNRNFKSESATFEYTFDRGPSIDERMIVITPIGN